MSAPNIIPSIFTAKDMYSIPVTKMGIATTRLGIISDATMTRMSHNFSRVGTAAFDIAHSMSMLGLAVVLPLGLATRAAVTFEKEMGNVGTLVDTTKENMGLMGEEVLNMSKKIPKPIKDLSEALYQIRSDGIKAGNGINEAFGVLTESGKLAVTGLSSVKEAAESTTSAMNVFNKQGLTSAQITNSFFKAVQGGKTTMAEINAGFGRNAVIVAEAGVSFQEYMAMMSTITMTGQKAATAQIGIAQAVTALIKPSSELSQVYEALGYTGPDAFKKIVASSGGLVAAMTAIDKKGSELGISFGEDFREKRAMMTDLLLTGSLHDSYLEKYKTQMDGVNVLDAKFIEQNQKAAQKMQLFYNSANRLGIRIGNLLIPVLNRMMGIIEPIVDGIADFAKEHSTLSKIIITSIAGFGLFALTIGAISFAVGTLTKGFILIQGATKAYNFLMGVAAVKTGTLNGVLLETPAYARGAAFAVQGLNAALARSLTTLVLFYGIWKLLDKKNEAKHRMEAITAHLPAGVDKKKFEDQFGDILLPGHIPLIKRLQGVTGEYPKSLYDSLSKKFYDEPMRIQDSIMNAPLLLPSMDTASAPSAPGVYGGMRSEGGASAGEDTQHKVVIEINNNSGHPVNATSSNAAVAVEVKTRSTFSRNKTV